VPVNRTIAAVKGCDASRRRNGGIDNAAARPTSVQIAASRNQNCQSIVQWFAPSAPFRNTAVVGA
jgi:hypothetical protein